MASIGEIIARGKAVAKNNRDKFKIALRASVANHDLAMKLRKVTSKLNISPLPEVAAPAQAPAVSREGMQNTKKIVEDIKNNINDTLNEEKRLNAMLMQGLEVNTKEMKNDLQSTFMLMDGIKIEFPANRKNAKRLADELKSKVNEEEKLIKKIRRIDRRMKARSRITRKTERLLSTNFMILLQNIARINAKQANDLNEKLGNQMNALRAVLQREDAEEFEVADYIESGKEKFKALEKSVDALKKAIGRTATKSIEDKIAECKEKTTNILFTINKLEVKEDELSKEIELSVNVCRNLHKILEEVNI